MSTFEEKLNKHIDKVIALQNSEREKMLSPEELKELDLSLGMTEEEWTAMMKKAEKNVDLAQKHLYYKNYRDAYTTAESALSLNPHLTRALIVLADSALKIYETERDENFFDKAEKHAKDILRQEPAENRAVEILSELNKYRKAEKKEKKKFFKYAAIGSGILIVIFSVIFLQPEKEKDNTVKFELIEAEENADAAWAQVENVLARRDNLIPQLFDAVKIKDARFEQLINETKIIREKLAESDFGDKISLQSDLQKKYSEITQIISENNTSGDISTLMIQIEGAYNRISVEGKRYNEAAKQYNILVKKYGSDYPEFKIKPYFKGK